MGAAAIVYAHVNALSFVQDQLEVDRMTRIVVAGWVDVPADKRQEALEGAKPFIIAGREEAGCIAYNWTPDPYQPERIHIFEEWSGQDELAEHLRSEPYKNMLQHLSGVGIAGSSTQKYRVDHFEPVYDETGVPRADFFTAAGSS
ncbi:MAG: antibiotic biosynthesis monooxygenase [Pseudomonadota bacterium]